MDRNAASTRALNPLKWTGENIPSQSNRKICQSLSIWLANICVAGGARTGQKRLFGMGMTYIKFVYELANRGSIARQILWLNCHSE